METLCDTGNGEITYEEAMRHTDTRRTAVSELGQLGLNDLGGGDGAAGCAD